MSANQSTPQNVYESSLVDALTNDQNLFEKTVDDQIVLLLSALAIHGRLDAAVKLQTMPASNKCLAMKGALQYSAKVSQDLLASTPPEFMPRRKLLEAIQAIHRSIQPTNNSSSTISEQEKVLYTTGSPELDALAGKVKELKIFLGSEDKELVKLVEMKKEFEERRKARMT